MQYLHVSTLYTINKERDSRRKPTASAGFGVNPWAAQMFGLSKEPASKKPDKVRVLIVDHQKNVVNMLHLFQALSRKGYLVKTAESSAKAILEIEAGPYDIVLIDLELAGTAGMDFVEWLKREHPEIDFIVLMDHSTVETTTCALRMGACDFLIRPGAQVDLVATSIERAIAKRKTYEELRRTKERLSQSKQALANLVEQSADGIVIIDGAGIVRFANESAEGLLGISRKQLLDQPFAYNTGDGSQSEVDIVRDGGERVTAEVRLSRTEWEDKPARVAIFRDVTASKQETLALLVSHRCLEIVNRHSLLAPMLEELVLELKKHIPCKALGIRILDEQGKLTLVAQDGFDASFLAKEGVLDVHGDQGLCLQLVQGVLGGDFPGCTKGGSVLLKGTSRLFALSPGEAIRAGCRACNQFGQESIALIPIRMGARIHGLLHLADPQENRIPLQTVQLLEGLAIHVSTSIDRLKMQQALTESEQLYRTLVETSPDAIALCDGQGKILRCNPQHVDLYGLGSAEDARGCSMNELISPEDKQRFEQEFRRAMDQGTVRDLEFAMVQRDGSSFQGELSASTVKGADGQPASLVTVARDVTEKKRLMIQIAQAEKAQAVNKLAAGIAHEINSPLQFVSDNSHFLRMAITNMAEIIKSYQQTLQAVFQQASSRDELDRLEALEKKLKLAYLSRQVEPAFAQLNEGIDRLRNMGRAIREYAYPNEQEKIPFDLNRIIQNTVTLSRNEWKYVSDLLVDCDASLPLVECYPGEINQLVLSLILNSAQAISEVVGKESGEKGSIEIHTRADGAWVEIRIWDSGPGIPAELREKIFEPFFTTRKKSGNSGQGLTIARSIVESRHGGTNGLDPGSVRGTAFVVRLPVHRRHE